MEVSEADRG